MNDAPLLTGLSRVAAVRLAAEMARNGLFTDQLMPWWSPDTERTIDPMNDPETRAAIVRFLGRLQREAMAIHAEGKS